MNVENINFAIEVMKSAKNLQMETFQDVNGDEIACTIDDLHRCGNTACFVGYLSLTDKYKEFVINTYTQDSLKDIKVDTDGTVIDYDDDTDFDNSSEYYLSRFLDIKEDTAHGLIYGNRGFGDFCSFYDEDFSKVKPEHVIEKLNLVLEGELK